MKADGNMHDAIGHIMWSIDHSPKTYAMFRKPLSDLRKAIVNAELRYKEKPNG